MAIKFFYLILFVFFSGCILEKKNNYSFDDKISEILSKYPKTVSDSDWDKLKENLATYQFFEDSVQSYQK